MSHKHRYNGRGRFFFFPLIAAIFLLAMGGVVMILWNAILPDLVSVNPITYWQAVGLLVLCRILFGNFRKGGSFGSQAGGGPRKHSRRHYWREKWSQMSPEEREEMKEKWKNWWDKKC